MLWFANAAKFTIDADAKRLFSTRFFPKPRLLRKVKAFGLEAKLSGKVVDRIADEPFPSFFELVDPSAESRLLLLD